MNYTDFIIQETVKLLSIDSPTGYTSNCVDFAITELQALGYKPIRTAKGGILVDLGGKDRTNAVMLQTHLDTLGGMVCEVKSNGRLRITNVGGLRPHGAEGENVRVVTKFDGNYEGTLQLCNASVHVNIEYADIVRSWDKMEVVLDERTSTRESTLKLGVHPGDFVCFDPRTTVTEKGYIKSRFLDDKLSVGILLGYAKYLKDENITPERQLWGHITVFEEVGHGGAASVPAGVTEVISVDMGCVGDGLECTEHQVSICAKDMEGPYHYDVVCGLINAARRANIDYAVDVYPRYGSDVDTTLASGHDIRHGLIGPGVYASHGYERSHKDGVENTFNLLKSYLG